MNKTRVNVFCFISLMATILMFAGVAWAALVPDTGQTQCYNAGNVITCPSPGQAFYGQDANYSINPMSFTKLDGSGNALSSSATSWVMVKDNVTGLVWEMKTNKNGVKNYNDPHDADNTYTWYDSNPATNGGDPGTPGAGTDTEDFIKALNDARYGGYSDWRMPTIKELAYIVNYSIPYPGPTIDTGYFPNTTASYYWSSTTNANYTFLARNVDFYYGRDFGLNGGKGDAHFVRAVQGGQSGALGYSVIWPFDTIGCGLPDDVSTATGGYADNGDGTVTDTSTGLMWQQQAGSSTQTWEQALAYCEGLNLGGHTDWRLPTINELRSLVDYSRYNPAINATYFPNAAASWYWSSTTYAGSTYYAWSVHFNDGFDDGGSKYGDGYARAVRGGQYWPLYPSVISVSPANRAVAKDAGSTTFSVSNTGTGTMPWTATVTSGDSWLLISSGASGTKPWTAAVTSGGTWLSISQLTLSGTNSGTISCSFTTNTSTSARTGTIRVTVSGATSSSKDVTVTQASTVCTATLDENLLIHIPDLASLLDRWNDPAYWANFVYEYNPTYPTLIIFKISNLTMLPVARPECVNEKSTYSDDFKIYIPALLLADGITRLSVDMEYSPGISTNGNTCFVVTKYEVVPNVGIFH